MYHIIPTLVNHNIVAIEELKNKKNSDVINYVKHKSTQQKKHILKKIIISIYDSVEKNDEMTIISTQNKEKYFFYADQFWTKIMLNDKYNKEFYEIGFRAKKNMMKFRNTNQKFTDSIEEMLPLEYYLIKLYTEDRTFFTMILDFFKNLL
jgi:hypothetical protein